MGLSGALQIGRTGLLSAQAALQVTGNNLANVSTRGYHRQVISLAPSATQEIQEGIFIGRGVEISAIRRMVDNALETRLRGVIADSAHSGTLSSLLGQIEAIENEFSDVDLSTRLGSYFNAWSALANNPQDMALRTLLLQESATLANFISNLDAELKSLRVLTDRTTEQTTDTVNDLLTRIEELNHRVVVQEHGTGGAAGLRDQRGALIEELSQYLDISTIEAEGGAVDIYVGSLPIMLNGVSRGVKLRVVPTGSGFDTTVVIADDNSPLDATSGELGALIQFRQVDLEEAVDALNSLAGELIWQTNRLHTQGQGLDGYTDLTGAIRFTDANVALNDAATGLKVFPTHGSFQLHITQKSTGQRVTNNIAIDLDGINAASDTTLTSLAAAISSVTNVSATVTTDGRLRITSGSNDFEISFSDDTSGVLAALGIHTFFTGSNAFDIAVNDALSQSPGLIAAATEHVRGDNRTALELSALRDKGLTSLSGLSMTQFWNRHVEDFAIRLGQARESQAADEVVRESLETQRQSISGVNVDEEAIDLIRYQRAYQASARFLSVVDELFKTILTLV